MDDQLSVVFVSAEGTEGWEDELPAKALDTGAAVLRLPNERGVVVPDGVGDGALLLSITAAVGQIVRLVLFLIDRLQSGIVVDCRHVPPTVSRNADLRRGEMLVIDNEGSRLLRPEGGKLVEADISAVFRKIQRSTKRG